MGNSTKVVPAIAACSRQLVMPATTASRDSRAPCRKNSAAMANMPTAWQMAALLPSQGSTVASNTVAAKATTNLSMFTRGIFGLLSVSRGWRAGVGPRGRCDR